MNLNPIQWHDGMMLQPHHFQKNDDRWHQLVSLHLSLLSPYHYGVLEVEYDPILLTQGRLRVLSIDAIMPDHQWVSYRHSDQHPLEIDLTPYSDEVGSHLIYLSVPTPPEGGSPVMGDWPRYRSVEEENIKDWNDPDSAISVPKLEPILTLVATKDGPPPRYTSFPLVQVQLNDESFRLGSYIPPSFYLDRSHDVLKRFISLTQRMRQKVNHLSQKWQNQNGTLLAMETTTLLMPLLQTLPLLEGLAQQERAHPYFLFHTLCDAVGRMSALMLSTPPKIMSPFRYNQIHECFNEALDAIEFYLNSIQEKYQTLSFKVDARVFSLKLNSKIASGLKDYLLVGFRACPGMDQSELSTWVRDSVICSEHALEGIKNKRITGAQRQLLQEEELLEIVPPRGVLVYRVPLDSEFILPHQTMFIFNASDQLNKRPSEIFLYLDTTEIEDAA